MNANWKKIEKLQAEYAKNDKKIAALMERQQEIEKQCTALENLEIVGMVRGLGMSYGELAAMLNGEKKLEPAPAVGENPEAAAAELNNEIETAYAVAAEDFATGDCATGDCAAGDYADGAVWNG